MAIITIPTRSAFTTPSGITNAVPCLQCLSEKELLAALVAIFANALSKTGAEALEESACFKCLSRKQMLQGLVTLLGNELVGEAGIGSILAEYRCLVCTDQQTLLAALLYLLQEYLGEVTLTPD